MNQSTPAIVTQGAVKRLPRLALLLFCIAYVLPGFLGRVPWKSADIAAYGYMAELAGGHTAWFSPRMLGLAPEVDALLPYWLGAWAIQTSPAWLPADFSVRIVYGLLLTLALAATWYGTYYLARDPRAQPVAFAFGGEALPTDYARAMADGGLLAFIACLGLAQLAHETTPALAQLAFTALFFYATAAWPYRVTGPAIAAIVSLIGLSLSGAPTMALLLALGCALIHVLDHSHDVEIKHLKNWGAAGLTFLALSTAWLATQLNLWRWRMDWPGTDFTQWQSLARLLLWFTWPAWPLALWTLWRWRSRLTHAGHVNRHLAIPLYFVILAVGATLTTTSADRSLLLALPAMAALAAFALPTLKRSVAALIDWFTLIFFTGCALTIWIVWISMQTGIPKQPAINVSRLAPGFEHSFGILPFSIALIATLAWAWLVQWRVGRHRAAIWKSLVLPAGGAALCWLLLMTLWLPLLDYARSYAPLVRRTLIIMKQPPKCVEAHGLSRSQIAAFQFHGHLSIQKASKTASCPWLIVDKDSRATLAATVNIQEWAYHSSMRHPSDRNEDIFVFKRL